MTDSYPGIMPNFSHGTAGIAAALAVAGDEIQPDLLSSVAGRDDDRLDRSHGFDGGRERVELRGLSGDLEGPLEVVIQGSDDGGPT